MRERGILLKVRRQFSPVQNSSTYKGIQSKNYMKDAPQKRSFRNKKDGVSAQEVEIINLDYLEVASAWTKRPRSKRSTTPRNIQKDAQKSRRMTAIPNSAARQTQQSLLQRRISWTRWQSKPRIRWKTGQRAQKRNLGQRYIPTFMTVSMASDRLATRCGR